MLTLEWACRYLDAFVAAPALDWAAQVTVVCSVFFAGITGSGVADVAALGSVLIPAMKKEQYSPGFAAAVSSVSSILGPIIPPSIFLIVYGSST
ncbi:MAG: TRAP transporter large permease subunit, partial [Kofleriaceae bacterium]|nr:TRAP transporter large permease subunit [Kofleriaceae bacterium]